MRVRLATTCCSTSPASSLAREELGVRNATDLLSVSFSSNDSVGHTFGPESAQVHDIALKVDRTIGTLLNLRGQDRRPAAHDRRAHRRSRRRPGPRIAARTQPSGWAHDDQGAVRPDPAGGRHEVRRRQLVPGHGGLVAVSELRSDCQSTARSGGGAQRRRDGGAQGAARRARLHTRSTGCGRSRQRSDRQPRAARLQ